MKPIRVLHITEMLSAAGIESFFMNIYRRIDKTKVQFDFLVLRNEREFYDDEIKKFGGIKYWIHSTKNNTLLRIIDESCQIKKILKEHPYDIIHIHYTTPLRAPYLYAAMKSKAKIRIYHAHSAYVPGKNKVKLAIYDLMRKGISKWATDYFACSWEAAKWVYEKKIIEQGKVKVVYNGIDVDRFCYNDEMRNEIRKEYSLGNEFVLIHTGRFSKQKNQSFIIDVFESLKKKIPGAHLLLLGSGEQMDDIKAKAHEKQIDSSILFLGVRSDVNRYLSAADCYIMPSLYEGLPVAAVEAQCAGLPCVFSTNITKEVALTSNTTFLSLEESVEEWCKAIYKYRDLKRVDTTLEIIKSGYDVQTVAINIQEFYEASINRLEKKI